MVPVCRIAVMMALIATDSVTRFVTPVFLHAGIIHYLLNMLAQLTVSAQVGASEWRSQIVLLTSCIR